MEISPIIIFTLFMLLPIFIIFLKIRTEKFQNSATIMSPILSNKDVKLNNSQTDSKVIIDILKT